jgi:pimeloyl-ACP methyl ester carboxylesterase
MDVTVRAAVAPEASPGGPAGQPFDLPGGPDAALLLHGLTGSPFEMRYLAERLHAAGLRCLGPVMPGHGGDARALQGLPWATWVEGARRELARLDGARRTFIVGCSMGALVACALAHALPERVDGLALLAPALAMVGLEPFRALAGFARPLLVVAGTADQYCPREALERLARELPRATVRTVEGAEHFFFGKLFALGEIVAAWARDVAGASTSADAEA